MILAVSTRERCGVCGNMVTVGFKVPDAVWELVTHPHHRHSIHCLSCFTSRADEKLVAWDAEIEFFPVSLRSHLMFVGVLS